MADPMRAPDRPESPAEGQRSPLRAVSGERLPWRERSLAQLTLVRFR